MYFTLCLPLFPNSMFHFHFKTTNFLESLELVLTTYGSFLQQEHVPSHYTDTCKGSAQTEIVINCKSRLKIHSTTSVPVNEYIRSFCGLSDILFDSGLKKN